MNSILQRGKLRLMNAIDVSMCSHLLDAIRCSCLGPHCYHEDGFFKVAHPPRTTRFVFSSFLPSSLNSSSREKSLHPWYADPLCCPHMPSLLMEGLASLYLSHGPFILVDRSAKPTFTQALSHWAEPFTTSTAAANEEACLVQVHCLWHWCPRSLGWVHGIPL